MSIHIWCPRASESAIKLRDSIRAAGVDCYKTRADQQYLRTFVRRAGTGDLWINWGKPPLPAFTPREGVRFLNQPPQYAWNKRNQLIQLAQHGVPCPEVFDAPGDGRVGRSNYHQEGRDILSNTGHDYWTQRLNLSREVRVHVFNGLSIRAGVKIPRIPEPHPWVRSYSGGWRIDYGVANHRYITAEQRELAKRAVAALGLNFGAVDIGITADRRLAVLEVNLAPGLDEGPSIAAYTRHILRVYNEGR